MSSAPVIAFGQQPCGFFPRRFLAAKILTARRLQSEIGGEIVFFYHDSDHDPRETQTILRHRHTREPATLNFAFVNKVQRKFSPLFQKRIAEGWRTKTELQLPNYVDRRLIDAFRQIEAETVGSFCLEMYRAMGWLDGIQVVRSGDPEFRRAASALTDYFVDVEYEGELVRARWSDGQLKLHEGGDSYVTLPAPASAGFLKEQMSPTRDSRLRWMQSVLHCTHYIAGAGERAYLRPEEAPEITFITRDPIDDAHEAFTQFAV